MSILNITKENFSQEVLKSKLPVLVDFWAPWCQPCQMMALVLEEVVKKFENKIKIVKIDISDPSNQSLAEEYQIQTIPSFKFFKEGKIIKELFGSVSKEELEDFILLK